MNTGPGCVAPPAEQGTKGGWRGWLQWGAPPGPRYDRCPHPTTLPFPWGSGQWLSWAGRWLCLPCRLPGEEPRCAERGHPHPDPLLRVQVPVLTATLLQVYLFVCLCISQACAGPLGLGQGGRSRGASASVGEPRPAEGGHVGSPRVLPRRTGQTWGPQGSGGGHQSGWMVWEVEYPLSHLGCSVRPL